MSKRHTNDMFKQMGELFLQVDKSNKKINKMDKEHKEESVIKDVKIEKLTKENNKNAKPYKTTEIDVDISVTVTEYLYYPDEYGKFNVPQKQKNTLYMEIT